MSRVWGLGGSLIRDLLVALLWLLSLALYNHLGHLGVAPVLSIFPYLLPTTVIALRHGYTWAWIVAAFASLAAIPGNYLAQHSLQAFCWAGLSTYVKLSIAAIGFCWGFKRTQAAIKKP